MKCLIAFNRRLGFRRLAAATLGVATFAAFAATASAQQNPAMPCHQGTWSPVYDWHPQLPLAPYMPIDPNCPARYSAFSHAALLPTGLHRGKVLLWRLPVQELADGQNLCTYGHMTSHLFNPDHPSALTEIVGGASYEHAHFMCSGMSWDSRGGLITVGGRTHNSSGTQDEGVVEIWRFNPSALGATLPIGDTNNPYGWPIIFTHSAWTELSPSLAIRRYYPSIIGLNRDPVTICGIPMAGKHLVAGGNWKVGSDWSLEYWEMAPLPATQTPCALAPALLHQPNQMYLAGNTQLYDEDPVHTPTDRVLDSYPRMMQLTSGQVFVAGDIYAGLGGATQPPNDPGQTWVMTPPYNGLPNWMLSDGPDAGVLAGVDPSNDRDYGNAVIFHTRDLDTFGNLVQNRIFTFNGQQDPDELQNPFGATNWAINRTVQEFVPGGQQAQTTGAWDYRAPLLSPRMWANAVVLPTRDVLILGGYSEPVGGGFNTDFDEYQPELYTIGAPGVPGGGSSFYLLPSSIPPGHAHPTPRRYHSTALLLPDGRIFMVGGEVENFTTGGGPESQYSGEMCSPPYLFTGYRPVITNMCPTDLPFQVSPAPTYDIDVTTTVGPITKVVLLRPAAVTHDFDNDQRYIELEFTTNLPGPGPATVTIKAPTDDLGPPGWYLLFLIESGPCGPAPSEGQFMHFR
jgi:hypothetical protein